MKQRHSLGTRVAIPALMALLAIAGTLPSCAANAYNAGDPAGEDQLRVAVFDCLLRRCHLEPTFAVAFNLSPTFDEVFDIALDGHSIFIAGKADLGAGRWHIEKRSRVTGVPDFTFGSGNGFVAVDPSPGQSEPLESIHIQDDFLYAAGIDRALGGGNHQWHIEKRSTATGSLDTSFGASGVVLVNPTVVQDKSRAVTGDAAHIYVAGEDVVPGDVQWRLEKRTLAGALVTSFGTSGVVQSNPSVGTDNLNGILLVEDALFLYGGDLSAGNTGWRVEKRSATDGSLVTGFGSGGVVQSNPSAAAGENVNCAVVSEGVIFLVGVNLGVGSGQWRIEKRSIATGALEAGFGSGGVLELDHSASLDEAKSCAIHGRLLLVGGNDGTAAALKGRLQAYDAVTGSLVWSLSNWTDAGSTIEALTTDAHFVYLGGRTSEFGDVGWRVEKRYVTDGNL